EAAKASKVEEDRRASSAGRNGKENGIHVGLSGSLSRFKLGSMSLNHHHRPFVKDKEHEPKVPDLPLLPGQTAPADGFTDKERHGQEEKEESTVEDGLKDAIPGVYEEESNPSKDIQALPLADHRQENQEQAEKLVK